MGRLGLHRFIIGLAVAGALVWATSKFDPPMRTLRGWGSDHLSHVSASLLFLERGYRIYVDPPVVLLEPAPNAATLAQAYDWDPEGVLVRPDDRSAVPLLINWPRVLRAYPPGDAIVHSPIGWLYGAGLLGIDEAARAAIVLYLIAALAASGLFWRQGTRALQNARRGGLREGIGAAIVAAVSVICASQLVLWAVEGFYDPIFVLCLLAAMACYRDARWSTALLWYSMALCLHFRALWSAPLAIACVWQRYRDTRGVPSGRLVDWQFTLAVIVGAAAMVAFGLFYAHVVPGETWEIRSTVYPWSPDFSMARLVALELASVTTAAVLWWRGDRLGASIVATIAVLLPGVPQVQAWHSLALVPLVFHCAQRGSGVLAGVACAFYAGVGLMVFDAHIIDVSKLRLLLSTLVS